MLFKYTTFNEWLNVGSGVSGIVKVLNVLLTGWNTNGLQGVFKAGKGFATSLISVHPVITSLIAAFAALKFVDTFVFDADEKFEYASKAVSSYQETKSEIESINSELDTTKKQIDELNAKETLSLVEQDELDKLTKTNDA